MTEEFRDIKGFEGRYQISNFGRVKRLPHLVKVGKTYRHLDEMIMKNVDEGKSGYYQVCLDRKTRQIHRLVAEAFIDNPENKPVVNHIDYNRKNNNVNNLEWVTQKENLHHSKDHLLCQNRMTGELNISWRKRRKPYHLAIVRGNTRYQKSFATLEEAVKERDIILQKLGEPWAN